MSTKKKNKWGVNSPDAIRRLIIHTGWVTPVIGSVLLPAHGLTSPGFLSCSSSWDDSSELIAVNGAVGPFARTVTVTNTGTGPLISGSMDVQLDAPFTAGTLTFNIGPVFPDPLDPGATYSATLTSITGILPISTQGNLTATFTFAETTCQASFPVDNQFFG